MYREGSWVLGNHLLLGFVLTVSHHLTLPKKSEPSTFLLSNCHSCYKLRWPRLYLWIFLSLAVQRVKTGGEDNKRMILCNSRELKTILHPGKK